MATLTSQLPLSALERSATRRDRAQSLLLATSLTPVALLVHGYHPYAEDGGIYIAGVKHLLHPELYPRLTQFVVAPTRFSLFAPVVASLARITSLTGSEQLPFLLFALHLATIWGTLYAASALARRCWANTQARAGAVLLLACWLGMPVAGTSLLFMDPYLTARSFSTPCAIAALAFALDATGVSAIESAERGRVRGLILCGGSLTCAGMMHPLMAVYALFATLLVAACRLPGRISRLLALGTLAAVCLALAGLVNALAPPEPPGYVEVALTRTYWFLSRWHWYELVGIAGPALLLSLFAFANRGRERAAKPPPAARALAAAAVVCAAVVTAVALFFCRVQAPTHLVAALQPMRGLHFVYLVLFLTLGAWLGENVLRRNALRWMLALPLLGGPLFAASRCAAPGSGHIELPGAPPANSWVQAFVWVRRHTPPGALIALPATYVGAPGEDAQGFRAIAERSALPDYSKDGGEAAIAPFLTPAWIQAQAAQTTLASDSDAVRGTRLAPLGVSWLVLPAGAETGLPCPFTNAAAKVCRLPDPDTIRSASAR